jgi:plasmid stability protein
MTLTINLPDEDVEALSVKAREQGMSAEQYVQTVLKHNLQQVRQPISARIR